MKKLYKILESCYLCARFPFLYPRNRFTGRHRVYALRKPISKLYQDSIQEVSITGRLENNSDTTWALSASLCGINAVVGREKQNIIIYNDVDDLKDHSLRNLLWNSITKFKILGISAIQTFRGIAITVHVKTADESDKTNYGFHFETIKLVKNKFKYSLYKLLSWIDSEVLDRLLFIPTYTELDAMPEGWRKAFGIQMCKDIKKQLKKDHYLYKYRITQIKEKFGTLRWYDECSSRELKDIIQKYEDLSWNTCIECGKPSTKISSGWITPYCDNCFPKSSSVYQIRINNIWVYAKDKEEV